MVREQVEKAAEEILGSRWVAALTGAGLSVESGIPPFRGPGGLWTRYGEPPMDGYQRFLADPRRAWEEKLRPQGPMQELVRTLAQARPNPGHLALAELERLGVLQVLITQNVDDLHRQAGSVRVEEIHGNYRLVRCIECGDRRPLDSVSLDPLPPHCWRCGGILKSDTVSFGEPIPADVLARCLEAVETADCMIVAGTSATVYPAAQFPRTVAERGGTLIEVNPHPTELTPLCDVSIAAPAGEALPVLVDEVRKRLERRR